MATGQNSFNCSEESRYPVADNHFTFQSIYNLCSEEVVDMVFMKKHIPWNKGKTCPQISEAKKGHNVTEETRRKISESQKGEKNHFWGKHQSDENKKKISDYHKSNPTKTQFQRGHVSWIKGKHSWSKGKHLSEEHKKKIGHANRGNTSWLGKHHSEETKKKLSKLNGEKLRKTAESRKGVPRSEQVRKKISESNTGKHQSEEAKRKNRLVHIGNQFRKGKHLSEETKRKISKSKKGRILSEETRRRMSESRSGDRNWAWKGGISFEPYCQRFNNKLKEKIRDRDNRTCQLCGIKENGRKLCVHHIHYDKENCEPDLISLCDCCNKKVNFNRNYWKNFFVQKLRDRGVL